MSIKYHSAVLITNKIKKLTEFYTSVMELGVQFDFGNSVIFDGGLSIWLPITGHPAENALSGKNNGLELCFETDDFESDAARVKASGIQLIHDIREESWGQRTLRFFDPDGNAVELGESMPCFCRRLKQEGMSIAEVSEKTGIQLKTVEEYLGS